jgi:hypothetical protein
MKIEHIIAAAVALAVSASAFAAAPSDGRSGTIWVLTDLSYEVPSTTNFSPEFGFGPYGVGGGVNYYPSGGNNGLMLSARAGYIGVGYTWNAEINVVGSFSRSVGWRLGAGVEYVSFDLGTVNVPLLGENVPLNLSGHGFVPMVEASIGFRL